MKKWRRISGYLFKNYLKIGYLQSFLLIVLLGLLGGTNLVWGTMIPLLSLLQHLNYDIFVKFE